MPGSGEAVGEPVLGEVIAPDIRGGVREIVRLLKGGKATLPDIVIAIVQSSIEKEIDISGTRAEYLRAQAMAAFRECLVGLGTPRSRSSKPRTAPERLLARGTVDPKVAGQVCCEYLDELYSTARRRPGPSGVVEADVTTVDVVFEE
jgi:hypothetical protein